MAVMAGYSDVVVLRHPEPGAVSVSTVLIVLCESSLGISCN